MSSPRSPRVSGAEVVVARCESHTTTLAFRALSRLLRAMFKVDGLSDAEAREHTAAQCSGAARTALCRRANPVRRHGHRRHQCTSTAGQRRWPTPPAGRGDGAGCPGTLGPNRVRTRGRALDRHAQRRRPCCFRCHCLNATSRCSSRPTGRSSDGALHRHSGQTVTLQPLTDSTAVRLVGQLLGRRPVAGGPGRADRSCGGGQPILRRGDRPGPGRPRCAVGESRWLSPDGRCRRNRRAGNGTGGARRPHRSAAR